MSTSTLLLPYARQPPKWDGRTLYSNFDHVLNWDVVEFLVHNQDHYAQHAAKLFCGYVYACTGEGEERPLMWYEAVWVNHELVQTYRSSNLEKLILRVCDNYGDA